MFSKRGLQETAQAYSKEEYKRERVEAFIMQGRNKTDYNTKKVETKEEHRSSIQQRGTQE